MAFYPTISVLIPTLNAASVLGKCLASIENQDYPKNKVEIIVADGGSTDQTLLIAKKYGARIYPNPLKTGEAGKAVALKHARGELVALIDSDNLLPEKGWFKRMVEPLSDPEIVGSEPWEFTYRKEDGFIDRYAALLGMGDPLCLFLGNYDKKSILTGKWTNLPISQKDKEKWIEVTLRHGVMPTIGANGTVLRRKILTRKELVGDYLFDIDILAQLVSEGPLKFAKVKIGVVHLYCGSDIKKFIRKQKRRVKDYLYYQKAGLRKYSWQQQGKVGLLKFIFASITVIPLLYQAMKGYLRVPDCAWFFHPVACWIVLATYSLGIFSEFFGVKQMDRQGWSQ